jgi:hypothetical protein
MAMGEVRFVGVGVGVGVDGGVDGVRQQGSGCRVCGEVVEAVLWQ